MQRPLSVSGKTFLQLLPGMSKGEMFTCVNHLSQRLNQGTCFSTKSTDTSTTLPHVCVFPFQVRIPIVCRFVVQVGSGVSQATGKFG